MQYTKKVIKTGGGFVIRIPSYIIKVMNLTEKDYLEVDISKIDIKGLQKKSK